MTAGGVARVEVRHVPRTLGLSALVFIMFFTVSGGAYGLEDVIGESGAGMALLLILITPIIWAIPAALVVAELATALPIEGGYYYWVKRALGPFWGFQEGWWSWITSWVDMAIYPVLFVEYSAYFFPELFGEEGSGLNRWLLGAIVIWVFTLINIRGAKVVGDSSILFGIIVHRPVRAAHPLRPVRLDLQPLRAVRQRGPGNRLGLRDRSLRRDVELPRMGRGLHRRRRDEEPATGLPEDAAHHRAADHRGLLPSDADRPRRRRHRGRRVDRRRLHRHRRGGGRAMAGDLPRRRGPGRLRRAVLQPAAFDQPGAVRDGRGRVPAQVAA